MQYVVAKYILKFVSIYKILYQCKIFGFLVFFGLKVDSIIYPSMILIASLVFFFFSLSYLPPSPLTLDRRERRIMRRKKKIPEFNLLCFLPDHDQ